MNNPTQNTFPLSLWKVAHVCSLWTSTGVLLETAACFFLCPNKPADCSVSGGPVVLCVGRQAKKKKPRLHKGLRDKV